MAFKMIWTADAVDEYMQLLKYLSFEWGNVSVDNFIARLEKRVKAVSLNPDIGKIAEKKEDARSVVITARNKLYYEVGKDPVTILTIFDTRQNPSKNRFQ